jgi:FKBP-type peptidyl-prolyl cis-trans isomerase FkpA
MSGDSDIKRIYIILRYILLIALLFSVVSCKNISTKRNTNFKPGKNEMADLNRYLLQKDKERIQNYIERKNLIMTETPTGLWYLIKKEGSGPYFTDKNKIVFNYECYLLDGTKCYSSQTLGPKEVILGQSSLEPGLNEGLRMMKSGAEAIFILPSYLAYGLIGDRKMIPSRAIIVYNVNILQPE